MKYFLFICLSLHASESATLPTLKEEINIDDVLISLTEMKGEITQDEKQILEKIRVHCIFRKALKEAEEAFSSLENNVVEKVEKKKEIIP